MGEKEKNHRHGTAGRQKKKTVHPLLVGVVDLGGVGELKK